MAAAQETQHPTTPALHMVKQSGEAEGRDWVQPLYLLVLEEGVLTQLHCFL